MTDHYVSITPKGRWVVKRMKEIDPEAYEDLMNKPLYNQRRGKALQQALKDWDDAIKEQANEAR